MATQSKTFPFAIQTTLLPEIGWITWTDYGVLAPRTAGYRLEYSVTHLTGLQEIPLAVLIKPETSWIVTISAEGPASYGLNSKNAKPFRSKRLKALEHSGSIFVSKKDTVITIRVERPKFGVLDLDILDGRKPGPGIVEAPPGGG